MWDNLSKLAADLDNDISTQLEEDYKEEDASKKDTRIRAPETPRTEVDTPSKNTVVTQIIPSSVEAPVPAASSAGAADSGTVTPEEDGFEIVTTEPSPGPASLSELSTSIFESSRPTAGNSPEPDADFSAADVDTRMEVIKLRKAANEAMANAALLEDTLQAKEEEVLQSQTALDNLQSCLEAFQATRDAEAEMHVSDSGKIVKLTTELESERRECTTWRQRYEETESTSAQMQVELTTEQHRIKLLEESLLQEKTESRRLSFQLSEIKAKNRRTARKEDDMLTITTHVSPDEPAAENRGGGTFAVLFEKGPFGAPLWFMFYVMFVHFLAWWFHRKNHGI